MVLVVVVVVVTSSATCREDFGVVFSGVYSEPQPRKMLLLVLVMVVISNANPIDDLGVVDCGGCGGSGSDSGIHYNFQK